MKKNLSINIAICGAKRSGKSSLINLLCQKYLNEIGINSETLIPTIYTISSDTIQTSQSIREINTHSNADISNQTYIKHIVDSNSDLLQSVTRHNIGLNLYEIPTPTILSEVDDVFEWISNIISSINLIIYISDIESNLADKNNTAFLEFLIKKISCSDTKLLYIVNKCDDMAICLDEDNVQLMTSNPFDHPQHQASYQRHVDHLNQIKNKHFAVSNIPLQPIPVSLELSYIYLMIQTGSYEELDYSFKNKLCKNECGNNTWKIMNDDEKQFTYHHAVSNAIERLDISLINTGYEIFARSFIDLIQNHLINFLNGNIRRLEDTLTTPLSSDYESKLRQILDTHNELSIQFEIAPNLTHFWERVQSGIELFVNETIGIDTDLYQLGYLLPYVRFESIHTTLNQHLSTYNLIVSTYLWDIDSAPYGFLSVQQNKIVKKIFSIYEQLVSLDYKGQRHISPANLAKYMSFIADHASADVLEIYCQRFLSFFSTDTDIVYPTSTEADIIQLLKTIGQHIIDQDFFKKRVVYILFNRQNQMAQSKDNINYFLSMKEYLANYDQNKIITLLTEVNQFNLRLCVKNQSFLRVMGSDTISYDNIRKTIDHIYDCPVTDFANIKFEQDLIALIS